MLRQPTTRWLTSLTLAVALWLAGWCLGGRGLDGGGLGAWVGPNLAEAQTAPGIVFVFDSGGAPINGERVRRAIAAGLREGVVRITDDEASRARASLTIAFEAPDRWLLEITRGEARVVRRVRLRTPSAGSLARVAIALIHDTEPFPVRAVTVARRDDDWLGTMNDEIIDPFRGAPPARRGRAVLDELIDPFSGGATSLASGRRHDGVIDPWAH